MTYADGVLVGILAIALEKNGRAACRRVAYDESCALVVMVSIREGKARTWDEMMAEGKEKWKARLNAMLDNGHSTPAHHTGSHPCREPTPLSWLAGWLAGCKQAGCWHTLHPYDPRGGLTGILPLRHPGPVCHSTASKTPLHHRPSLSRQSSDGSSAFVRQNPVARRAFAS